MATEVTASVQRAATSLENNTAMYQLLRYADAVKTSFNRCRKLHRFHNRRLEGKLKTPFILSKKMIMAQYALSIEAHLISQVITKSLFLIPLAVEAWRLVIGCRLIDSSLLTLTLSHSQSRRVLPAYLPTENAQISSFLRWLQPIR